MAKLSMVMRSLVVVLAAVMTMASLARGIPDQSEAAVDAWFANLPRAKQKMTKIHLFIHDISSGPDSGIVMVAQANSTATSPTQFGLVSVANNKLTAGPEMDSDTIGYVEGIFISASKANLSFLVANNFVITEGKHKGSTLSVLGRVAEFLEKREFPVLGGSGDFRLAQGIIIANVYSADAATGNSVVECKFNILHFDERKSSSYMSA